MNATIQKWGNSLALRIPSAVAKDVRLQNGSMVEVSIEGGTLVVRPKKRRRKYTLARLLKGMPAKRGHGETDWGAPVGREAW